MKSFLIFLNSFLLIFQPMAGALSKTSQARMKEFLEVTEITKREVTFQEFYSKIRSRMPKEYVSGFDEYIRVNGAVKMPKFTVSKVMGENGEEDIHLSFITSDKKSVLIQLIGRGQVVAKIGDTKFSEADMANFTAFEQRAQFAYPNARPMTVPVAKDNGLLSAEQIRQLSLNARRDYFKKIQKLMATMEKLDHQQNIKSQDKKTSSLFELFVNAAEAAGPGNEKIENEKFVKFIKINETKCIYAGYVATYGKSPTDGTYTCAGIGSDFYEKPTPGTYASAGKKEVVCNPTIYGDDPAVTVASNVRYITESCNKKANAYDAFPYRTKKYNSEADWTSHKLSILAQLQQQLDLCGQISNRTKIVLVDQHKTCEDLKTRVKEIESTTCGFARDEAVSASQPGLRKFADACPDVKPTDFPQTVDPVPTQSVDQPPPQVVVPPVSTVTPEQCEKRGFTKNIDIKQIILEKCEPSGGVVQTCSTEYLSCHCPHPGIEGEKYQDMKGLVVDYCTYKKISVPPVVTETVRPPPRERYSPPPPRRKGIDQSRKENDWLMPTLMIVGGGLAIWGITKAMTPKIPAIVPAATPVPLVAPTPPRLIYDTTRGQQ